MQYKNSVAANTSIHNANTFLKAKMNDLVRLFIATINTGHISILFFRKIGLKHRSGVT